MEYNGLHFSKGTVKAVAEALYKSYKLGSYMHIHYGSKDTGRDNVDLHGVTGKLIKKTQSQSVLQLKTDLGVSDIDSSKIVKLVSDGVVVYKHPLYHIPTIDILPLAGGTMTLSIDGVNIATSVTSMQARHILDYLNYKDLIIERQ